jgi:hypothetical protein
MPESGSQDVSLDNGGVAIKGDCHRQAYEFTLALYKSGSVLTFA